MRHVNLNSTSKYLSHLIFQGESFKILRNYGLENVYIGDYGFKRIHANCLYFLVNPTIDIDSERYRKFEDKIISFNSFYDWYDVFDKVEKRMYVYNIHPNYKEDFNLFINRNFDQLSESYWSSLGARVKIETSDMDFVVENEIYRFSDSLEIKKGDN